MSQARIAPLQPPYQPETAAMLAKWMPPGAAVEPLVLFRTLAVHDELFSRMRPLGAGILGHPRLEPRDREILILRTCARSGAEYEWGVHAETFGRPLGLTDQQIAATAAGQADDPA
jgi:4-carboxymuconolactone decarboxylase